MRLVSAILSAFIVALGYFAAMNRLDKKYKIGFKRKKRWIVSREVVLTGVIAFMGTGVLGYIRLPQFSVALYALTLLLLWGLPLLAVTDYKKQWIPNRLLIILLLVWTVIVGLDLILNTGNGFVLLFRSLSGGIVGGLIFFVCYALSRKQLGAGDVKLVFVMGMYLTGQRIMGAVFYGTLLCCIYSVIQLCRKKIGIKDGVAMVPFLYIGTLITLFIL